MEDPVEERGSSVKGEGLSSFPRLEGRNGVKGVRTPDLVIANDALYQLSYDPCLRIGTEER